MVRFHLIAGVLYSTRMRNGNSSYFAALDGIRAVSILFVVFHHAAYKPAWMAHFHGWLGVDIFFVLSGFLITFLLEQEKHDTGKVDLGAFYVRRAFRILPVYSVVLALYGVIAKFPGHLDKWRQLQHSLPYFLTFCNEFASNADHATMFGFSWTLGVEEKFYIVWPFLFFVALASSRWRPYVLAVLYLSLLAVAPFSMETARSYSGLMVGCFLALGLTNVRTTRLCETVSRIPVALPLLFLIFGFYLVDRSSNFVFLFSWIVLFLLSHLLLTHSWLRRFLSHPVLTWLGKRSYGMYLVHHLCLDLIQSRIHPHTSVGVLLIVLGTFGLSALTADLMFMLLESPARDYGKRLLARRNLHTESTPSRQPITVAPIIPADGWP
jgi:peptidoglycan/LPS O-acetylase OafA/YrhL